MTNILIETAYIKQILDSDSDISLIEVWANVLYVRMRKGSGKRNTFISKKGLTYRLPVYYYESEFKFIAKSYHPDTQQRVSKGKLRKQCPNTKLFQSINVSRKPLSELFKGRRNDGILFTQSNDFFTDFTSTKSRKKANISLERLQAELSKAGYCDDELFGGYCLEALGDQGWEGLRSAGNEEEIIQHLMQAWSDSHERLKTEDPLLWEMEERALDSLGL